MIPAFAPFLPLGVARPARGHAPAAGATTASWRPAWSVMLRYRADAVAMLGEPAPAAAADDS